MIFVACQNTKHWGMFGKQIILLKKITKLTYQKLKHGNKSHGLQMSDSRMLEHQPKIWIQGNIC